MIMYCESKNYNGTVIFDVSNIKNLLEVYKYKDLNNWIEDDTRSLIEVRNLSCENYKGPREGYWYNIPINFWEGCEMDLDTYSFYDKDPSLLFRFKAIFNNDKERKFNFIEWKI